MRFQRLILAVILAAGVTACAKDITGVTHPAPPLAYVRYVNAVSDTFNMDFGTSKGDCTVRTQIHFADGSKFDAPVDYCKVNHLYIHDDTISWD